MSPVRSDYLERQIAQLVEALAALLRLRRERKLEEAELLLQRTCREVLGMEYGALLLVDAASVAQLLGTPERIHVLAQLVSEEAAQLEARGRNAEALARRERALALYSQLRARLARPDARVEAEVASLQEALGGE
jgi:hypothetical protein